MTKDNKIASEEFFKRLNSLSFEADRSPQELREELQEEGINPDQLIKNVKARIQKFLGEPNVQENELSPTEIATPQLTDLSPKAPLLAMLKSRSGLKAKEVADRMGVKQMLLSNLGDHPKVIPFPVRKRLDEIASSTLPGVEQGDVIESTEEPNYQAMAAYSDKPFEQEEITYKALVLRSGLDEQEQSYWLSLAEEK